MNKIKFLFVCVFIMFLISGCGNNSISSIQKIVPPNNNNSPLHGKWEIVKILNNNKIKKAESNNNWIGKAVEFSDDSVKVGDLIVYKPNFKIRRVNLQEYLLFNHKSVGKNMKIPQGDVDVITIMDKDRFFSEALKINDDKIIFGIYEYNFYLKKVSDKIDNISNKKFAEKSGDLKLNIIRVDDTTRTGVFIGLKTPIANKGGSNSQLIQNYKYRTLWIAAKNRKLHPILETSNIFFPRRSGFWKIGVKTMNQQDGENDIIYASNLSMGDNNRSSKFKYKPNIKNQIFKDISVSINYVSNDCVSIETNQFCNYGNYNANQRISNLQTVPIDSLPKIKSIKTTDVVGKEGIYSLNTSIQNILNESGINKKNIIDKKGIIDNFGLIRKAGHWFFEGRINYYKGKSIFYMDYRINIIPPSNIVFYDDLSVTWTDIKERVPDAMDAFTSPNKDIAIILAKNNKLLIYEIKNGTLGESPLKRIILNKGEKIIMAEWATGDYVENWEKSFQSLKINN